MALSLRQIKNRIRSIENVKKVTSAMEMISVTKLNRIDDSLYALRPYFTTLETILKTLLKGVEPGFSPYLLSRNSTGKKLLCVISSDSGLCGLYNNNIIRFADAFIQKNKNFSLVVVGKSGFNYFKNRSIDICGSFLDANGKYSDKLTSGISDTLIQKFLSAEVDEVYGAYTYYENGLIYRPKIKKILNIEPVKGAAVEYIFEPSKERILEELMPRYVFMAVKLMLLESFTSEHAARSVAMKTATDNAKDLLGRLLLLRNKVRQASITQEIMEIISSSEALKG